MRKSGGGRLLLAVVALAALAVCLGCTERFGIDGGSVTLQLEENAGTEISWKKGTDLVAEWGQDTLWIAPGLKGRVELDPMKGSLTLSKLQQSDSGKYTAEVAEGGQYKPIGFCLRILDRPRPPRLNCTANSDQIPLTCEPDALHVPANISLTYEWKYQKSNRQIPGNGSKIRLAKDVDFSEDVTCIIHFLDANASSSLSLRDCIPPGRVPEKRNRAWILTPLLVIAFAVVAFYLWKKGYFNFNCKGKSQKCKGGTDAEVSPEAVRLGEEPSGNLEENSNRDPSDPGT